IPLFVEELTGMIAGAWAAGGRADSIPATLNELLLARLDQLDSAGKEVVQLGAVIGRELAYRLLRLAGDLDEDTLRRGLMQLVDTGMLRREGQGDSAVYVFKHALLQE